MSDQREPVGFVNGEMVLAIDERLRRPRMTWSITAPLLRGGDPVVRWDAVPLGKLDDEQFAAAVKAAEALGDDIVKQAERNPLGGGISMAGEVDHIIVAVMKEMDRRENRGALDPNISTATQPEESQNGRSTDE